MKIGIMQPYFFPYLGYFSLIKHSDLFILLDEVQFIRHGWVERNRILKQKDGWLYIKAPIIKSSNKSKIKDCFINNQQEWEKKILAQLLTYKKIAPFYDVIIKLINQIFDKKHLTITELNKTALDKICQYLIIDTPINIFSKMELTIDEPEEPDDWALNICKALGNVMEYWNLPGGHALFDLDKYFKAGIDLKFQKVNLKPYDQNRVLFEPGLSIIDVMMFNTPEEINEMLSNYDFI